VVQTAFNTRIDGRCVSDTPLIPECGLKVPECGALLGNRYRLERLLGEGGMGMVFLAVDQEDHGEMFAVKVLRPEIRANPESVRLLREEVRRTRALRHPHIVGVYSLNSDPSGVYMLMEYLEGQSLTTVLDEQLGRGMPLIRAWPVIREVGAALAYAHGHHVIHSDIKPSNVIITSSGSCKLLDFGIARADHSRAATGDTAASGALTPAYASCEMFAGRAPDPSDDVYSFACVIYEMLTGRHPYGRMAAVEARARTLQPAPIEALSKRQNAALARALEFDRERRTASVEILLEGLEGRSKHPRDRRAWYTSAVAVAAVFAVSTGWFREHHNALRRGSAADVHPAAAPTPPAPQLPAEAGNASDRTAAAQPPGHQFQRPASRISAGPTANRMTVASRNTATASANPRSLMITKSPDTNAPKIMTMIEAAKVTTRPVLTSPSTSAVESSSPARRPSAMRATMNTS